MSPTSKATAHGGPVVVEGTPPVVFDGPTANMGCSAIVASTSAVVYVVDEFTG